MDINDQCGLTLRRGWFCDFLNVRETPGVPDTWYLYICISEKSHFDMFVHVCVVSCSLEILWQDCWGFSFCKHLPGLTWLDKFKVWCYDVLYGKSLILCIIHPVVLSIVWQMASFNCRAHEEQTKAFQNVICCAYWLLYVIAQKFGQVCLNEYSMTLCIEYANICQLHVGIRLHHACHGRSYLPQPLRHSEDTARANWWRSRRAKGKAHLVASPSDLRAGLERYKQVVALPSRVSYCRLSGGTFPAASGWISSFWGESRWGGRASKIYDLWFSQTTSGFWVRNGQEIYWHLLSVMFCWLR